MNRKLIHLVVACFVLFSFTPLRTHANPDHLEPCLVTSSTYSATVFSALLHDTHPQLWMIVLHHRGHHEAVIIDERLELEEVDEYTTTVKNRQLFLKYVKFKRTFSQVPPNKDAPIAHFDVDVDNDLEHFEIPIDSNFETIIKEAWTSVLVNTKYPEKKATGPNDGLPFIFYCDDYFGYTLSPENGSPAMLVELGDKLCSLAQSEENDRDALKKKCIELAKAIKKETNPNQRVDPTSADAQSSSQ